MSNYQNQQEKGYLPGAAKFQLNDVEHLNLEIMKKILLITALFSLSFGVFAQRGAQREFPNPEERAERMTNRMAENLELSKEQKKKVYEINLENAQKRQTEMEARRAEMENRREARTEELRKQNEKIEAVLTPEQKEKWNELKESSKRRGPMMRERGEGQRGSEIRKGRGNYRENTGKRGEHHRSGRGSK